MSTKDTGGPAFPWIEYIRNEAFPSQPIPKGVPGMTLRDYFIAHAPAEPQPWFVPKCPPAPKLDGGEQKFIGDPAKYDAKSKAAFDLYQGRLQAHYEKLEEHAKECKKLRWTQWPAAWADEMLKARRA